MVPSIWFQWNWPNVSLLLNSPLFYSWLLFSSSLYYFCTYMWRSLAAGGGEARGVPRWRLSCCWNAPVHHLIVRTHPQAAIELPRVARCFVPMMILLHPPLYPSNAFISINLVHISAHLGDRFTEVPNQHNGVPGLCIIPFPWNLCYFYNITMHRNQNALWQTRVYFKNARNLPV